MRSDQQTFSGVATPFPVAAEYAIIHNANGMPATIPPPRRARSISPRGQRLYPSGLLLRYGRVPSKRHNTRGSGVFWKCPPPPPTLHSRLNRGAQGDSLRSTAVSEAMRPPSASGKARTDALPAPGKWTSPRRGLITPSTLTPSLDGRGARTQATATCTSAADCATASCRATQDPAPRPGVCPPIHPAF